MEKAPHSITCTTCQARLTVCNQEAIGSISVCPKCGSLVEVTPPKGWQGQPPSPDQPASSQSPALVPAPESPSQAPVDARREAAGGAAPPGQQSRPPVGGAGLSAATSLKTPHRSTPPPLPKGKGRQGDPPPAQGSSGIPAEAEMPGPARAWAAPAELLWRKWSLMAGLPAAGLVLAFGVWSLFFAKSPPELPPGPAVERPPAQTDRERAPPGPPDQHRLRQPLDPRWLPDGTRLVVSCFPSRLARQADHRRLIDLIEGPWHQAVLPLLQTFSLEARSVQRLIWASTDLAAWPERSVVVLELEQGHDAGPLRVVGKPCEVELAGASCRRLPDGAWPHPLAIVDRRTIVTGHVDLLRGLATRDKPRLESPTIRELVEIGDAGADGAVMVDLVAARRAGWKLPAALLDVWPDGKRAWHVIWEIPEAIGCTFQGADHLSVELALVCEAETAAEEVKAALAELTAAAGDLLEAEMESLPGQLQQGSLTAAEADQYEVVLQEALAASESARCETVDGIVWVRWGWSRGPAALAGAIGDSRVAIHRRWLTAARAADEANHRRLVAGLAGYRKAEGRFPPAAVGGALLPPQTRLSWLATMLPYYGHTDWHRGLDFAYPWNGPQNRPVTRRPLPEVVNPALGPGRTEAGFPVTHYVGLAGIGPDAGRLPADDPRAGLFGFGRTTRPEEIADGAAHTIATLGVTKRLGPWAAGGDPTVRTLSKRPYVNGPDGFGSGQPDGMLAGMADGSVRFIAKDIDPRVLEQLATIGGREAAAVAAEDPGPGRQAAAQPGEGPKPSAPGPPAPGPGPQGPPDSPPDRPAQEPRPEAMDHRAEVAARLAERLPQIQLPEMPLADAVDLLAELSDLPITLDPEALERLGVRLDDAVAVELSDATLAEILAAVAAEAGLALVVEDGQVLLSSPPADRDRLRQRRYTVSDLTGEDATATAELAAVVRKLVVPDAWQINGGRGTIQAEPGMLVVLQNAVVHHRILVFCEKLRNARGKPLRSHFHPDRFALATRRARAGQILARQVTANFQEPAPLEQILEYLEELTQTEILIDHAALRQAGLSAAAEASLSVRKQPLASALDELLRPRELDYRVVEADTLQVTTRNAVAGRMELEFYPIAALLAGGQTETALLERIKSRLAGSTWSDAGGPGVLHFDGPSRCLIVLQSQPVQRALEDLLTRWRGGPGR